MVGIQLLNGAAASRKTGTDVSAFVEGMRVARRRSGNALAGSSTCPRASVLAARVVVREHGRSSARSHLSGYPP